MEDLNSVIQEALLDRHKTVAGFIALENARQDTTVELIASENFPSDAVRAAAASSFVSKYCEGYPVRRETGNKGRYYGGCQYADSLEQYCCRKWQEVFHTDYHVNVQPHSGSQANAAAYYSVLNHSGLTPFRFFSIHLSNRLVIYQLPPSPCGGFTK